MTRASASSVDRLPTSISRRISSWRQPSTALRYGTRGTLRGLLGPCPVIGHARIIANEAQLGKEGCNRALQGGLAVVGFDLENLPPGSGELDHAGKGGVYLGLRGGGQAGQALAKRFDEQDRTAAPHDEVVAVKTAQPGRPAVEQGDVQGSATAVEVGRVGGGEQDVLGSGRQ